MRWVKWLIVILLAIAVAIFGYAWYQWSQIPNPTDLGTLSAIDNVESILVIGSDTRQDLAGDEFGGASVGGQRADTIMVLTMPPGHAKSTMLSIPRDLRVNIPGRGVGKINGALNGGTETMVGAVENATGLTINQFVEVNFDGFRELSTALGGVEICVDNPIRDAFSELNLDAGCHNLEGDDALAWVRSRHAEFFIDGRWQVDPQSDLSRIRRQQEFMQNMFKKMASPLNVFRITAISSAARQSFTINEGFGFLHALRLGIRFFPSPTSRLNYVTYPVVPQRIGGIDFVVPEEPQASTLLAALQAGQQPPAEFINDPADQVQSN